MNRYHIGSDGEPRRCTAQQGKCPLGGDHFDALEDAEKYAETKNEAESRGAESVNRWAEVELPGNKRLYVSETSKRQRDLFLHCQTFSEACAEVELRNLAEEFDGFRLVPGAEMERTGLTPKNHLFADGIMYDGTNPENLQKFLSERKRYLVDGEVLEGDAGEEVLSQWMESHVESFIENGLSQYTDDNSATDEIYSSLTVEEWEKLEKMFAEDRLDDAQDALNEMIDWPAWVDREDVHPSSYSFAWRNTGRL